MNPRKIGNEAGKAYKEWHMRTGNDIFDNPRGVLEEVVTASFTKYQEQLQEDCKQKAIKENIMTLTSSTKAVLNGIVEYYDTHKDKEFFTTKDLEPYVKGKKAKRDLKRIIKFLNNQGYFEECAFMADEETMYLKPSIKAIFYKEYKRQERKQFWVDKIIFSLIIPLVIALITALIAA